MLFLGFVFILGALVALFFALGIFGSKEETAATRLSDLMAANDLSELTFDDRSKNGSFERFTPKSFVERAERNYMLAGRPEGLSVAKILSLKVVLGSLGFALGIAYFMQHPGIPGFLFLVVGTSVGYFGPDVLLGNRARARQEKIQMSLPDMLDQITISIESGSSFESALTRVGHGGKGPLAEEVVRTVQDMALGMPRRDAYQAWADRTDVEEVKKLTRAIVQGEEFGVPIAEIVREQSREMRVTRRLRAEGKANEVPVKMLFPLMATILPVLFLIVIGPAVINAMAAFKAG